MSQSTFLFAALLAGFILFLAAKGRLAPYGAALWGNTKAPTPSSGSSGGILGTIEKGIGIAKGIGEVAAVAGA